ncbi:MAG TPA: 2-oxo acid dehydrogenase subunit E2, partial [Pirellulales bacterium]
QVGGGVAFSLSEDGQEQILLVHEVRREAIRSLDAAAVIRAICQAVAREHEVRLDAVGLVRPGSIARTTSGKTEHHASRRRFACGEFEFIELWRPPAGNGSVLQVADENDEPATAVPAATEPVTKIPAAATPAALANWICAWLGRRLALSAGEIDAGQPLALYGLDSLMAVELQHDVEQAFGRQLDVGTLIDAPSIAHLAEQLAGDQPRPPGGPSPEIAVAAGPGVVRPTYCGPWGDRADGILVRAQSPMREIMPYLMRRRNESVVYHEASYDVGRALEWLDAYNRQHAESRATLLDLFLWAAAYVAHARPGMNRFVSGRRIYQRREVAISFAAKKRYDPAAELVTIKLRFPEQAAPFAQCVDRIAESVAEACQGPPRAVDRETQLVMLLPRFLLRAIFCGYRILDHCNLLPGPLIANDPLYATIFVANLGSLGLESASHHLYEHGTCSLFAALGSPKKTVVATPDGGSETRHLWPVRWTLDERIIDGFYSAGSLRLLQSILENPADFVTIDRRPEGAS